MTDNTICNTKILHKIVKRTLSDMYLEIVLRRSNLQLKNKEWVKMLHLLWFCDSTIILSVAMVPHTIFLKLFEIN